MAPAHHLKRHLPPALHFLGASKNASLLIGGNSSEGLVADGDAIEEEVPTPADVCASFEAVGMFLTLLLLLYHTHSKNELVRHYTWTLLKNGIDIFLAVNVYFDLHDVIRHVIPVSGIGAEALRIIVVIVVASVLMHVILYQAAKCKGEPVKGVDRRTVACVTLAGPLGHAQGFVWLHAFTRLQKYVGLPAESASLPMALAVIVAAMVAQLAWTLLAMRLRAHIARTSMVHEKWEELCDEAELDSGSLMLSGLTVQTILFSCQGLDNESARVTDSALARWADVRLFFGAAVASQLLLALGFSVRQLMHGPPSRWATHVFSLGSQTLAFVSGWCFLIVVGLFISYTHSSVTNALMLRAMACTLVALLLVALLGRLAFRFVASGRRTRGQLVVNTISAFSVAIGFAWEGVFDRAVENLAYEVGTFIAVQMSDRKEFSWVCISPTCTQRAEFARLIIECFAGFVLLVVTIPASFMFITPEVEHVAQQKEHATEVLSLIGEKEREERIRRALDSGRWPSMVGGDVFSGLCNAPDDESSSSSSSCDADAKEGLRD